MKTHPRVRTTDREIDAALRAARARPAEARLVGVCFDRAADVINVTLSTGTRLSIPRRLLPGLSALDSREMEDLAVQSPGRSIWSERADTGLRLETLLEAAAGTPLLLSSAARVVAGRTSPAKAAAARENGRKGGRPKKKVRVA
jgi:hypothetical protein